MSGVSDRRQKPAPAGAQTYDGVAASRPSIPRSRIRSNLAKPRATMMPTEISRMPPMKTSRPTPSARSTSTTMNATSAIGNADRL